MVAVIGSRRLVNARLGAVLRAAGAKAVVEFPSVLSLIGDERPFALLIVDLSDRATEDEAITNVSIWQRLHPNSRVLAYVEPGGNGLTLFRGWMRHLGAVLLTPEDLITDFLRKELEEARNGSAQLLAGLYDAFTRALEATGRRPQNERYILNFLELAPENVSVGQLADATTAAPSRAARKAKLTRALRSGQTLAATDLLVLMKILWWVYLRDRGMSVDEITGYLHTTPRNFRKHTHDRLGLTMRVLKHLPLKVALAWVAELCVERYATPPGPRTLLDRLMGITERFRGAVNLGTADWTSELFRASQTVRAAPRNQRVN